MDPATPGEIAKATGEVAKFGTKALAFFERIVGAPLEQAGAIVSDEIVFFRAKRQLVMRQVLEKAQAQLEQRSKEPTPVPAKTLAPLLAASSLEEDQDLIELWATLLANAADPDTKSSVQPQFVRMLAELSSHEVSVLEVNHWAKGHAPRVNQKVVFPPEVKLSLERVAIIRDHFVRLGIARHQLSTLALTDGVPSDVEESEGIYFTITGVEFLLACHAPLDENSLQQGA